MKLSAKNSPVLARIKDAVKPGNYPPIVTMANEQSVEVAAHHAAVKLGYLVSDPIQQNNFHYFLTGEGGFISYFQTTQGAK